MKLNKKYITLLSSLLILSVSKNTEAQQDIWELKITSNTIFKPVTFSKIKDDTLWFAKESQILSVGINTIEEIRVVNSKFFSIGSGIVYGSIFGGATTSFLWLLGGGFSSKEGITLLPLVGVYGIMAGAVIGAIVETITWLFSSTDMIYPMKNLNAKQKTSFIKNEILSK